MPAVVAVMMSLPGDAAAMLREGQDRGERDGPVVAAGAHVVDFEAVHGRAVDQGGGGRREAQLRTPHRGVTGRLHLLDRLAHANRPGHARAEQTRADRVEHQQLHPVDHVTRDVVEFQVGDEFAQTTRVLGVFHVCSLSLSAR